VECEIARELALLLPGEDPGAVFVVPDGTVGVAATSGATTGPLQSSIGTRAPWIRRFAAPDTGARPIPEDRGDVGANFIIEWQSNEKVVSPGAEAIMSGGMGTQGLSFATEGRVIERHA
jgi:hypothetical protein